MSDHTQQLRDRVDQMTFALRPISRRYTDDVVRDGFRPHLPEILEGVRQIWNERQELPFVILSRMPVGIDYYEPAPGLARVSTRFIAACFSLRNLVRLGLSECLYVWQATDDHDGCGDCLFVLWRDKEDTLLHCFRIRKGKQSNYLAPVDDLPEWVNGHNVYNPLFDPWHKDVDILSFLDVPEDRWPEERKRLQGAFTMAFLGGRKQ